MKNHSFTHKINIEKMITIIDRLTYAETFHKLSIMKWEAIIKAYPDDAEGVRQARQIFDLISKSLQTIDIPELDSSSGKVDILDVLPYSLLGDICTQAWKKVFNQEPDVNMEQAIGAFIKNEELPDLPEEYLDVIAMFVHPAVTLYLNALRQHNTDLIPKAWDSGKCPFCQTYPRIAYDSESSRKLNCLLCGNEWEFPRIKCPYCSNNDHETLGYFEAEGIEGVKVYYCNQCKQYLKVVDTRQREACDAETEDVLTLALDEVAQQEGYL